jgi:hypothetical protein
VEPQHDEQSSPKAHPISPYSAYFAPRAHAAFSGSTIRLPGDFPRERVVRPALAVLYRVALGPSADRYVRRFLSFERTGHGAPGWHWPSLLFPGVWAFYRKLWGIGLVFALLPIAGSLAFGLIEPAFERADSLWIVCAVVAVWILPGVLPALLAESLLYGHCRYLITRAEQGARGATEAVQWLSKRTPTSTAAALLLGGGALVAMSVIVVPPLYEAYNDLNVRAQLVQALAAVRGLEQDIEDTWSSARLLPRQTDNPELRAQPGAALIEDVHVHPGTGRVRLALGPSVPELSGKTILLAPARGESDHWHWLCVPVDIPSRYLPKECRG